MTVEQNNAWMAGELVANARFRFNDVVTVLSGEHKGATGAVISLLAVSPEPRYLIELSTGRDIEFLEHELQPIG